MSSRPQSEALRVDGPVGALEALIEVPGDAGPSGVVVVCHPHPLHGGSMQNKVAHMLAKAFTASGFAALRFNFRGVGASEGQFADGEGEVGDVAAMVDYARERFPGLPLWLAGFSFGAAMAVRSAAGTHAAGLVAVAPAASRFVGTLEQLPTCPWLMVHGDADDVVPIEETVRWLDSLPPGPELVVFEETGHFFHGKLVELRETVVAFIARHSDSNPG